VKTRGAETLHRKILHMSSPSTESNLFSPLPQWRAPWSEFFLSYGVQVVVIAILVWIPVLHPEILAEPKKDYTIALVSTPAPVNHAPQRQLPKPVLVAQLDPPPAALRLPAPQPKPKIDDTPAPEVKIAPRKLDPLPPSSAPVIPKIVRTNVFSTGSSAPQTIEAARAPQQVQTGGFGDPNGVPAKTTQTRAVNIAQAGGFDMPTGPGSGNGTGGANGARGVVASTGFGNGVATADPHASRGPVRQAGFGDSDVAAPPTVQAHPAVQAAAKIVLPDILAKPKPVYSEEGRAKHIEGEVLLEVVFEASGKVRVLRVVRGLGHGLDESAVQAAEQIQFKPALKDGQPSDYTAVLHVVFQLA
jgi:TonB family protein